MEQELISKRELLEIYQISYGALYRWKRKGLIPEEWFIKKSVATGQETFFPRHLICERIELIKKQKDDFSLEKLAQRFSTECKHASLVVDTAFGKRVFYLCDIRSVMLDHGDGTATDLTSDIIGGKESR